MADPYVREIGRVEDIDTYSCRIGVDYDTVTVGPNFRFNRIECEEFAQLFVSACWEAGVNLRHMAEQEVADDGV